MAGDETRLPPQEALREAQKAKKGRHRIYLGYAAGVGKTYAMLREGNRLLQQGQRVVIGVLEHHGRQETLDQVGDLPIIPKKRIPYKGVILEEMDLDAILTQAPDWVLVDELAHTNVPGSRNTYRYQDIQELLEAGINVMSTVNVQHVESLNDIIGRITDVEVRETFPDWVLDQADEIILVDIPPEVLEERLRQGKVYDTQRAQRALKNFFRKGNLLALRELTLRKVAQEMDDLLGDYRKDEQIEETWATSDRILVAITPQESSRSLIRTGWRVAQRLKGDLYVVHVRQGPLKEEEESTLDRLLDWARSLGAVVRQMEHRDLVEGLMRVVEEEEITQLVIGASRPSRWQEILYGSPITRILRRNRQVDLLVVSDRTRD
ncbi:MAG: universal stress protein [Bacillota bacterium]|nr:universal stress protein [Bacillota bacterium]